jgi:hypothetical protein
MRFSDSLYESSFEGLSLFSIGVAFYLNLSSKLLLGDNTESIIGKALFTYNWLVGGNESFVWSPIESPIYVV